MDQRQHYVQDACELYAVAMLQLLAESDGLAVTKDSEEKFRAFEEYAAARALSAADFDKWPNYKKNVETHLPSFFADLVGKLGQRPMDFVDVEREYRNLALKGDFVIRRPEQNEVSVSLKNYHENANRPQCSSGTFNSFPLGFIFEGAGSVGMFLDGEGKRFKGSTVLKRDAALARRGLSEVVPLMRQLDVLNADIKARFVYSKEFAYLDEAKFDLARKEVGARGQEIILEILNSLGPAKVKERLLKMTSLDGTEEILILDPTKRSDTITNETFSALRRGVSSDESVVTFGSHGQSIRFRFELGGVTLLTVDVPFTINKNGAWVSDDDPDRYIKKEGQPLVRGQRRPKKSKELATSTNTYVDFAAAGIF